MRRGSPALHKKYDWRLALNAGDALHAIMWGALLRNRKKLSDEKTLRVMEEFFTMVSKTTEGQHIELGWVVGDRWDLTEEDYFTMCTNKTSWYTVIGPMRLGGVVGGADNASLKLTGGGGEEAWRGVPDPRRHPQPLRRPVEVREGDTGTTSSKGRGP